MMNSVLLYPSTNAMEHDALSVFPLDAVTIFDSDRSF